MSELDTTVQTLLQDFKQWESLPVVYRRQTLVDFQRIVEEMEKTAPYNTDEGLVHYMGDRTYGREANVKAGVALVGMRYNEPQINILIKGVVFVATENKASILEAPCVFVSDASTNKVGYVIEDMKWITVMNRDNECVDPDSIMRMHTKHPTED